MNTPIRSIDWPGITWYESEIMYMYTSTENIEDISIKTKIPAQNIKDTVLALAIKITNDLSK